MASGLILIVDDEPSNLATLKQILSPSYRLAFARSGSECLSAAKKQQPALILLDIQMPDMDGYAVCRMLKADPQTESVPVIFISALGEVGDEAAAFESGGVDYLIKPVSPALVRMRVRTHLSLVRATLLECYVRQLEVERAKTARLSRIYAVLSDTNSSIVRIHEPQALLEAACQIVVDQGGFGIAWIAMQTPGNKNLLLAASKGVAADLLQASLGPVLEPVLLGPGVPLQVLQTGKFAFCNEVRASTYHDRAGQDALNRGYRSIVGLPLCRMDSIAGVMVLYAREANYFDDQELKLLSDLAGDISFGLQAIENEQRAKFLSYYDALTALPNVTLFLDRLEQLVQAARRAGNGVFIIAINLDRFKQLNDGFGRHIGDQVLRIVGKRLGEGLSRPCSVARISADNFVVMGEQGISQNLSLFCEEIIRLLHEPVALDKQNLFLSVRMGIASFPYDADTAESLFKNAEAALKQTKEQRARFMFYSAEINARMAQKIELENLLKVALANKQFALDYQPKVDLESGRIVGAEALIRWRRPLRGIVPPVEFIPLAEECGLIVPIGEWVIQTVCQQQAAWMHEGVQIVPVALNLSSQQFREGNVQETVQTALHDNQLESAWLELELTESLVMQNPEEAEVTMHAFRDMGLSLSLDDFGTGYSSLAYLKRFPFNTVKIDRAFVTDITQNPEDAAIASAIIGMAHSLHMHVIAEGVETLEQLLFLRARHCDHMQGYYFSRPIPPEEFEAMLRSDKRLDFAPAVAATGQPSPPQLAEAGSE